MVLCQNDDPMSWSFWQSVIKIGWKLWIFLLIAYFWAWCQFRLDILYVIGKRPIQYKKTRPSLQLVYCWKDNYDKICASLFHSYIAKVSVCLGCQSSLASLAKLFSDQISHILTEEAPLQSVSQMCQMSQKTHWAHNLILFNQVKTFWNSTYRLFSCFVLISQNCHFEKKEK